MKRFSLYLASASLGLFSAMTMASGVNPTLNESFTFRLGAVFLDGEVTANSQLKGEPAHGEINFDDVGLNGTETSPYVGARWRFANSWKLDLEYFGFKPNGSGTAETDLEFGDILIPVGVTARSDFDLNLYSVSVGWSFLRSEQAELGIGLGLHVADTKIELAGAGYVGGVAVPVAKDSADVTAPLPNVRLFGGYAFTPTLAIEGSVGYFSLSYDKYDGQLVSASAVLEWRPMQNFGLGAGYTYFDIDLDVDGDRADTSYDFQINGPMVYITAGF
jgi:hypothetical protein